MTVYSVEYVRRNPLFDPLRSAEEVLTEEAALERMRVLTSNPLMLEISIYRVDGRHRILLWSWTKTTAENGRITRQAVLVSPRDGSPPSGGGFAGI